MCEKQCRDENGFKCHVKSESHQRQMLIVASNPHKFTSGYSQMFENDFMAILRQRHTTKRIRANVVYNEYIANKTHVHMNATRWTTLSGFVQYLGKTGKCVVDETEKGWFIQYIDRDPQKIARKKELEMMEKHRVDHEARARQFIAKQVKLAQANATEDEEREPPKAFERTDEKVQLQLAQPMNAAALSKKPNVFESVGETGSSQSVEKRQKRTSELDNLMQPREKKGKVERKENWICRDIIVKIMAKELDEFYKRKARVVKVMEKFTAQVQVLETKEQLKIDQDELETVIPQINRPVRIVNGTGRGQVGTLLSLNLDQYSASIRLDSGRVLHGVEYEDFSKYSLPL